MSIQKVEITDNLIRLSLGGKKVEVVYDSISGKMSQAKASKIKTALQDLIDLRIPIASLPDDDPDKTTDPANDAMFWDGTDLVSRNCIVVSITWDGSNIISTLRVPRGLST